MTHNTSKMYIESYQENESDLRSDPDADAIFQILSGARNLKLLMHALEIGLFDQIAGFGEASTAEAAAKKLQFHSGSFKRYLDALVALGLLKKDITLKGKETYSNSSRTNKYLTRCKKPTLIAAALMESNFILPMLDILPLVLKNGSTGMNVMNIKKGVRTEKMTCQMPKPTSQPPPSMTSAMPKPQQTPISPEVNEQKTSDNMMKFLLCMDGLSQTCAPALVKAFDLSAHKHVVDLGGGSGAIAIELSKAYPETDVTVFDLPPVIQMAKKNQRDIPSRVTFYEGNFFEDEIPDADLYVLSHVLHDWDEDNVDIILNRVYKKLPPGGSLLVLEKVLNERRDGPLLTVTSDLLMSLISSGKERTESEYKKLFTKHGFSNTRVKIIEGVNYYDAMLTKKPFY